MSERGCVGPSCKTDLQKKSFFSYAKRLRPWHAGLFVSLHFAIGVCKLL